MALQGFFIARFVAVLDSSPKQGGVWDGGELGRDSKLQQFQDSPFPQIPPAGRGSDGYHVSKIFWARIIVWPIVHETR